MQNPIPPASGTTIIGLAVALGIASSVLLRHLGLSAEASLVIAGTEAALWLIVHPEMNRSIQVSPEPPNEPVAVAASISDHLG